MSISVSPSWIPLSLLDERFKANLKALSGQYAALAESLAAFSPVQSYFILPAGDQILLGVKSATGVQQLPHPVPPANARAITAKLYPSAKCGLSVAVGGEDLGWLWNTIYQLPCETPLAPGHRPPLFFLIKDTERFWAILHIQEWQALLADNRVRLFVGPNALGEFQDSLVNDVFCPWPKMSVTVDPSLWPASLTLDAVLATARDGLNEQMNRLTRQITTMYCGKGAETVAARFRSGEPLNILGITSRYTTFLQHSMRDWLASFERLGHRTHLLIEEHDHQAANSYSFASAYVDFKPDLVVVIDHYRREYAGLPAQAPFVMWIQDRLPNMFRAEAGQMQERFDYVVGYAKQECVARFGYPASRFLPSMIGVDERRFSPRTLTRDEHNRYGCDVSFVSHASMTGDAIVKSEIDRLNSPEATRLLSGIFDQLEGIYNQGGMVTEPAFIRQLIEQTMLQTKTTLPADQLPVLVDLFTQRVNNALFRHQTLHWLAEMDINLHLYGKGWETHPTLKRFARGAADNQTQLSTICQASAINLQVTPYGAAHQRLFDGLSAGGFFLLRAVPGDMVERLQRNVWNWCRRKNVTSAQELVRAIDGEVKPILEQIARLRYIDPMDDPWFFYAGLEEAASGDFTRNAATLWREYDQVSFSSREQLANLVKHFLASPDERKQIAATMRQRVLECHTYTAISRKLLNFIANDVEQAKAEIRKVA